MKKLHIILLIAVAGAIAVMISYMGDLTTYDTIASARQKPDQFVHVIARLDRTQPVEYNPIANPNYCSFTIIDSLGNSARVISHKPKPVELEQSERVVLKGRMQNNDFYCDDILLKCPSKYKDDTEAARKRIQVSEVGE
jgi:cytochrome c-type biogenesis protein CcmE